MLICVSGLIGDAFYAINTPFKELKCSKAVKHAMYILVPVML